MALLSESAAKAILDRALKFSKADACEVNLTAREEGNIRFARNSVSTAGENENVALTIQSTVGKKSGVTGVNELDDTALERAVRRSEELARLAPDDPELMPPTDPQTYQPVPAAYVERTGAMTADDRAGVAAASILPSKAKECTAAGFLEHGATATALANSKGAFYYHRQTRGEFTITARTNDGLGSGYASRSFDDFGDLDAGKASAIAIEKAIASREAKAVEPGKYTVILEPLASVGLLSFMFGAFDARSADEGRSFLSKAGGGSRVGEKFFDERVNIFSDPRHPGAPGRPWSNDGLPLQRVDWVKNGVVNQLAYSRFWAQKQSKAAMPAGSNVIMSGGTATTEELIRDTERGILVTRTWYIRMVDPQTLLVTGLTRDGTFFIENGQIKYAVKNFRFNESPVIMLNNVDALGAPVRVGNAGGGPGGGRLGVVPPMRIRDFTFSSLSDAV